MEYLSRHGVQFTERDIRADREALTELLELGSRGTPTTLVDDEMVIGFDRQRLDRLLGL
jgi:glutaredoxin